MLPILTTFVKVYPFSFGSMPLETLDGKNNKLFDNLMIMAMIAMTVLGVITMMGDR